MKNSDAILADCFAVPQVKLLLRESLRDLKIRFERRPHPLRAICIRMILFYQKYLSRHTCLFQPTCSEYTKRCIHNHGVIIGCLLGFYRILRCHPFSKGGRDPAPEKRSKLRWLI